MMVHFRRRLSLDAWTRLGEEIARRGSEPTPDKWDSDSGKDGDEPPPDPPESPDGGGKPKNSGQLIVDATCTPCDVRRPSSLSMADEALRKTEAMIDGLYEAAGDAVAVKPRTYRRTARKRFSRVARQNKPRAAAVRQELWYQLNCLTRNLSHIDELAKVVPLAVLSPRLRRQLPTIRHFLSETGDRSRHGRDGSKQTIYSLSQPWMRAIYRSKASGDWEFGPKLSLSLAGGFAFVDRLQWTPYNECADLFTQMEAYKRRTGCWPESVHADKIYHTRHNRKLCKILGIRLSAVPLGRPGPEASAQRRQLAADEAVRNAVEGKFGQLKRRFSLGRLLAKRQDTCESVVGCAVFCANLARREALALGRLFVRLLALLVLCLELPETPFPDDQRVKLLFSAC